MADWLLCKQTAARRLTVGDVNKHVLLAPATVLFKSNINNKTTRLQFDRHCNKFAKVWLSSATNKVLQAYAILAASASLATAMTQACTAKGFSASGSV